MKPTSIASRITPAAITRIATGSGRKLSFAFRESMRPPDPPVMPIMPVSVYMLSIRCSM